MAVLLETMQKEKYFYENTNRSYPVTFQQDLFEILCTLFQQAITRLDGTSELNRQEIQFYARFYSYGLVGLVMDWVNEGMKTDPSQLSVRIRKLADDSEKMAYSKLM